MELVSAQGKLKEAYRLAHIGTWDLVIESDTATWSEELYNMTGWDPSRKNIPAAELPGLYTADSWSLLNDAITKAIATGEPYNLELQIIRPDGSLRWVNEFGGVMRDRNGKVIGLHGTLQDITERKQMENALKESEEKFSKAFRSGAAAIVISTLKDGVFIEVNDSFCRFIGYTREELIGHTSTEFETWARAEDRTRMLRILKKKGRVNNEEYNFRTRSGELRNWLFSAELIDIGGEPCLLSVNTDITERKQAEAALRESEEKYRAIFEQGADPIVIIEEEPMRIVDFNDKAHENLGYTREEFVKIELGKINAVGGTEKVRQNIEEIHKKGILVFEEKQLTKSGEIRDVLISSKSLNIGGRWLQMGIWHDITEQKRAEEKIRLNERHVQDLLDLHRMTDATEKSILDHVLDSSNRSLRSQFAFIGLMSADEAMMTVHAWSKEAMKQYAITEKPIHFPIANAGLWGEAVRQRRPIIVNDYNTSKEYKKGYPKEHVTIKRFLSVPIFSDDKIVAVGAVANKVSEYDETDVSVLTSLLHEMWNLIERRRDEEKLKQAMVELESSGTKLQATNKELESFSYSVSHDLRSPLRSIDGFSQALLEDYLDRLDEKGQDYLKRLRVASQKMGELIDGLLKLSRLTRSEMRHEKVDLSTLANEIAARIQETNPHSRAKFVIGSDLTTNGDPQMLRVLLENLLGNAWKFTRKTRRAEIEFGITGNGAKKTFFIKDNGAGFDMAYKDKLFGAFQRLHDTTEFPGTGIGLATVLRIINRHGGSIRAEGAVGKGATFYFNLD
jgi:PAS domain S-box-containing protein